MPSRVQKLLEEAQKLSSLDRARLRAELHDEADSKEDVDASWTKEIERRVHELEQGQAELLDPEDVHARVFKKHDIR